MASNTAVARKVSKLKDINLDAQPLRSALLNLSGFYPSNTPSARRNLRALIERNSLQINEQFLDAFQQVQQALDSVQKDVDEMKEACNKMAERLQSTKSVSGKVIAEAEKLQLERKRNEVCYEVAERFLERFQLSPQEVAALNGPNIDAAFFDALKRAQQIHNDCKLLLRTQHQRAGLDLLDVVGNQQEEGYRRLYRWVRTQISELAASSTREPSGMLVQGLRALGARPVLLEYSSSHLAQARSQALAAAFKDALTKGGPQQVPRPIELHAHDPVRYVSDMLAWIHQALAAEFELLHSLLPPESPDAVGLLNTMFDGVGRPFKLRVDQVLESQPGAVAIYRIANLIDFYGRTVAKIMGNDGVLPKLFAECRQSAMNIFFESLKQNAEKLQRTPPTPQADLSIPETLRDFINRLSEILKTFDGSLVPMEERVREFEPVLKATVDPLLQVCTLSATPLHVGADMAVYLINCLSTIRAALMAYDFTTSRVELVNAQIDAHMDTLVEEQAAAILRSCGLGQKLSLLQTQSGSEMLSKVSGLEPTKVADMLRSVEDSVLKSGWVSMGWCDKLQQLPLRSRARQGVCNMIYHAYNAFYQAIADPKNGYGSPQSIFVYTPDQVKTILLDTNLDNTPPPASPREFR